jgi:hypothetical protein
VAFHQNQFTTTTHCPDGASQRKQGLAMAAVAAAALTEKREKKKENRLTLDSLIYVH